jgi:hypothetical protein
MPAAMLLRKGPVARAGGGRCYDTGGVDDNGKQQERTADGGRRGGGVVV